MLRDIDLVDDIIALRKRLEEAERQRDNALDVLMITRRELDRLRVALQLIVGENNDTDKI